MSNRIPLSHFPKLPLLDSATMALFKAIEQNDQPKVAAAIEAGARVDAIHPYFATSRPDEIGGGLTPLQAVCSVYPQRLVNLPILALLLEAGANANLPGELREDPLAVVCQRLPSNAVHAIDILVQHGAQSDLSHLKIVLGARTAWGQDIKTTPTGETTALDALWAHLPLDQRKQIDPSWIMGAVPDHAAALSYAQVKMVQWLSNHCQDKPQPNFHNRVENRRLNEEAPIMGAPSRTLH